MKPFKAVLAGVGGAFIGAALWFIVSFGVPIFVQIPPLMREDVGAGGIGAASESIPSGAMEIAMLVGFAAGFYRLCGSERRSAEPAIG